MADTSQQQTNTHYGVIVFSGDPAGEHPDPNLRGCSPGLNLIACGEEDFCWAALDRWIAVYSLRLWETAEVLVRDQIVVSEQMVSAFTEDQNE